MARIDVKRVVMCLPLYALAAALLLPQVKAALPGSWLFRGGQLLLLSFLLSYLLMPFAIRGAHLVGLVDHPDEARKQHKDTTALTGGLAIYCAFAVTILFNFHFSWEMKGVLIASTLILLVGLADDRWGLPAWVRLLMQVAAVGILIGFNVRVTFVPDWLGGVFTEALITAIWVIGITNSMNFIDGMDGLASGTSIIYSVFFAISAIVTKQGYMAFLAIAIAGSCLGFFPYNFRYRKPALVFLGDSGATFLGFLLASFALLGEWGKGVLDIAIPVVIMSVLIFDMTLTTIVRVAGGEVKTFAQWLHYTGRDHFHHRLSGLGMSNRQAAVVFFLVSVCFGLVAMAMLFADLLTGSLILIHSILSFIIMAVILVLRTGGQVQSTRTVAQ